MRVYVEAYGCAQNLGEGQGIARRRMERRIGRYSTALAVERGPGTVARIPNYLPVVVSGALPLGSEVQVRVDGARSTYLLGQPAD